MTQSGGNPERLHGFDALRGGLLLLGVVQHATGPFVPFEQYWVVRDINPNAEIGDLSFVIHVFRMTAFFALSGLFARMGVHRLGEAGFGLDRLRRIVLPLIVGWCAVIPATLALSEWTLVRSYGPDILDSGLAPPETIDASNIPLQHLWFLYILSLLCAAAVIAKWTAKTIDPNYRLSGIAHSLARRILSTPFAALACALPATLVLGTMHDWSDSVGIPTPNVGLFYIIRPTLVFGAAFAVGWTMHRHLDLAQTWVRWWPLNLAIALILTLVSLALSGAYPPGAHIPDRLNSLGQALAYSVAGWAWTLALVGLSLRFLSSHSPTRRYLADSSYWIYLVHPPLLLVLADAIRNFDWPAWLKLGLTVGVATAILLASYQLLVRHSFIGLVLNGKRPRTARLRSSEA